PAPAGWGPASVLEFDRVGAAWPGSDRLAVDEVSFRLRAGEHMVLSGPSGVGKSTVATVAARGLDPTVGSVRIDGVDLRDMDPDTVRSIVVVCDQDAHLFDTTIAENLRRELRHRTVLRIGHSIRDIPQGFGFDMGVPEPCLSQIAMFPGRGVTNDG
ncbi:ATP-binding cassette domain-containing protein, partial [Catenulispora rubra]|uniref:ATP-binding cassette domain-containing protein n=1 Tax=Catenulispora rubra TaxID=280293 RepID=UPI001892770F